jgi:glycosyltransferase involved in cell wall biosynthesis
MKCGVYNLGFLAMRNDPDAGRFLAWWSDRCVAHCRIDIAANMFTDQRWMDLAPAFIERHHILRHPGYNVAYWNLVHRRVEKRPDGQWQVDGQPLVFFHFSGIEMDDATVFSRHQNRISGDQLGVVGELCDEYRELVNGAGWAKYKALRYAFGSFPNGRPIDSPMRRWLLRAIDDGRLSATEPLRLNSKYFDVADEVAAARGIAVTRTMYQLWLDRADLQAVFDIYNPDGLESYYSWFLNGNAEAEGLDGRSIAAAEALRSGSGPVAPTRPVRRRPPWTAVADVAWQGAAADAGALLRSDVAFAMENSQTLLPRQAALLWELRLDLQKHYPLGDLDGFQEFVAWALCNGMAERALDPHLLSSEFVELLVRRSRLSLYYNDVPLTEGMLVTRGVALGRDHLDAWRGFPAERPGRLAHGIWYAFIAPKLFRWPPALSEPIKRYFAEETEIGWAGFRFNRGELAIWELRTDLQRRFKLSDPRSCWQYLHWLVVYGLRELQLTLDEFDPRLQPFLMAPSPRFPGLPQVLEMLREARLDLLNAFDIGTNAGRSGLLAWAERYFHQSHAGTPAEVLFPSGDNAESGPAPSAEAEVVHRAAVGLTGQWSAATGRGECTRMAAEALRAVGFGDFLIIDCDSGRIFRPDGSALPEGVGVELDVNVVFRNADMAFQDWYFLRRAKIAARKTIGFWMWELERLPAYWRHAFTFYDEIWAATEFARAAFASEALRPVKAFPPAVSVPRIGRQPSRAELGLPEDATVFLFMFDFHSFASRKNPEALVQAFLRAFPSGTENVYLLLKTQCGDADPEAWSRLNEVCTDPRIEIRDTVLERAEVIALIQSADAFVSLHRSEGFGRGPAEAMLLGKPVILTGYSGTADFATPDCAYVVDYKLKPVAADEYPGVREDVVVSWADPDIDMAAAHMRHVHQQPKAARALGKRARARIEQRYGPKKVGAAMLEALGLAAAPTSGAEPSLEDALESLPPAEVPANASTRRSRRARPILREVVTAK